MTDAERGDELLRTQIKMAELYEAKNDQKTALKLLRELLAQHPDNVKVLAHIGRLAHDLNLPDQVLEVAPRLVKLKPDEARYRLWLATALVARGRQPEALTHLQWLQHKTPDDAALRKDLAATYEMIKQPVRALQQYDWLVARFPRVVEYRLARSNLYGDLKRTKEQLAELEAVVRMSPKNVEARLELATFAFDEEKFDEAERQAEAILSVDPRNAKAMALLARMKAARALAEKMAVEEYRLEERYQDWQSDLQERSEDF